MPPVTGHGSPVTQFPGCEHQWRDPSGGSAAVRPPPTPKRWQPHNIESPPTPDPACRVPTLLIWGGATVVRFSTPRKDTGSTDPDALARGLVPSLTAAGAGDGRQETIAAAEVEKAVAAAAGRGRIRNTHHQGGLSDLVRQALFEQERGARRDGRKFQQTETSTRFSIPPTRRSRRSSTRTTAARRATIEPGSRRSSRLLRSRRKSATGADRGAEEEYPTQLSLKPPVVTSRRPSPRGQPQAP